MFYKVEYQKRAHQEMEKIFRVLFPEQGLAVREEQIRLCHEMLDTLLEGQIALCRRGGDWKDLCLFGSLRIIAEIFHADRKGKSVGPAPGGGVYLKHRIAESHLDGVHSIFIQGAVGTRDDSVPSSGSGAEREGTLCL